MVINGYQRFLMFINKLSIDINCYQWLLRLFMVVGYQQIINRYQRLLISN